MSTALRLTVAQYDRMVEQGAFDDLQQKIELIRGEMQAMNPSGPRHDGVIERLTDWSTASVNRKKTSVRVQSGLSLPEFASRPEPDLLWVVKKNYLLAHPTASDVLLVIEVSVSSLARDRDEKALLYAEAGIAEYWIVNATDESIHVFRDPSPTGYQSLQTFTCDDQLSPQCECHSKLNIDHLFHGE